MKLRSVLVAAATASFAVSAPLLAQITDDPVGDAPIAGPSFGEAVVMTVRAHLERRGRSADIARTLEHMSTAMTQFGGGGWNDRPWTWMQALQHQGFVNNWWPMKLFEGFVMPLPSGKCFGGVCNDEKIMRNYLRTAPGVVGDADCDEKTIEPHASGTGWWVPSVPLAGGGPIIEPLTTYGAAVSWNPYQWDFASHPGAAALWAVHNFNMGRVEKEWLGYQSVSVSPDGERLNAYGEIPPTQGLDGRWQVSVGRNAEVLPNSNHWNKSNIGVGAGSSKECPGGMTGGDFHFYSHKSGARTEKNYNQQNGCTYYAPNFKISITGYAYPKKAYVYDMAVFHRLIRQNPSIGLCAVSKWAIKSIADRLFAKANTVYNYDGAPYSPIELSDVRVPGNVPIASSLLRKPDDDFPRVAPPSAPPAPPSYSEPPQGYVPPPSGTGSGDPGGNQSAPSPIDVSSPTVDEPDWMAPEIEMPDWLPDFAQLVVPEGSGDCPVFGFDALGESFVMDSHCGFIESNRLTIASIMLVVFAFGAYAMVLRA